MATADASASAAALEQRRLCAWCEEPIPERSATGRKKRDDAEHCDRKCRQADHRFQKGAPRRARKASTPDPLQPRRFAYADPPYPGMAETHYSDHPDYAGEVDHEALIAQLLEEYPDGWALSTSSKTLAEVLALCPPGVRIGAWTKPVPPGYTKRARVAWEPVLFHGGRELERGDERVLDWIHAAPPRTIPGQVTGTKPARFAYWLFACLGARPGDHLEDLYPGSGAIGRAWDIYASRRTGARLRVVPGRQDLRDASDLAAGGPGDASPIDRRATA